MPPATVTDLLIITEPWLTNSSANPLSMKLSVIAPAVSRSILEPLSLFFIGTRVFLRRARFPTLPSPLLSFVGNRPVFCRVVVCPRAALQPCGCCHRPSMSLSSLSQYSRAVRCHELVARNARFLRNLFVGMSVPIPPVGSVATRRVFSLMHTIAHGKRLLCALVS
jgi:hypothetical protein